jgi:hypothetical protein
MDSHGANNGPIAALYQDRRKRTRATYWLPKLAWCMRGRPDLAWWTIPAWSGGRRLRWTWMLTFWPVFGLGITGLVAAVVLAFGDRLVMGGETPAFCAGAVFIWLMIWAIRPQALTRRSWTAVPLALVPRWPRTWRSWLAMIAGLTTGVLLRRVLLRLWAVPLTTVSATPYDSYRVCRRSTFIDVAAAVYMLLPLLVWSMLTGWLPLLLLSLSFSALTAMFALSDSRYVWLKLAEFRLLPGRRGRRVRFLPLLRDGVRYGVLTTAGAYFRFADPALQQDLAATTEQSRRVMVARIDARLDRMTATMTKPAAWVAPVVTKPVTRVRAAADTAKPGLRTGLLARLPKTKIRRISKPAAAGMTVAGFFWRSGVAPGQAPWETALTWIVVVVISALFGYGLLFFIPALVLSALKGTVNLSLWLTSRMPRWGWLPATLAVAWLLSSEPVRHALAVAGVAVFPAMVVTVAGGWVCLLVHRRCRTARNRLLRHASDLLVALVAGCAAELLINPSLVGAQAAIGPLLPVAVWLTLRAWCAMNASQRVAVRASADIVTALLLGGVTVMLLIWLANLLNMPPAEVAVVRDAAEHGRALIDLPWWSWAGLFGILAGMNLAFARWPLPLARFRRTFTRVRVTGSATGAQRALTGLHIGLLVTTFVGMAAPAAVAGGLRAALTARYTETLNAELQLRGELAAYRQIQAEFDGLAASRAAVLAAIVIQIDDISKPTDNNHDATGTELDLARRLGGLQALAILPAETGDSQRVVAMVVERQTAPAWQEDLAEEAATEESAEQSDNTVAKDVDAAGELAAKAVAGALAIPHLPEIEVLQIVREYLSGLIEESPLKTTLAAWAAKVTGQSAVVGDETVVPNPAQMEAAAENAVTVALVKTPPADPSNAEEDVRVFLSQSAITATVDLVNQVRYLQEDTGPCVGCAPSKQSSDGSDTIDEEHTEP